MPPAPAAFRRFFFSTLWLDILSRGLSAISLVVFVRGLSTSSFAYIILLQTVGQFAGSALTGGVRTRYLRQEAERVSRGAEGASSFGRALKTTLALIAVLAAAGVVAAELLDVGGSATQRVGFALLAAVASAGFALIELAMHHHQAHLRFTVAGLTGVLRGAALLSVAAVSSLGHVTDRVAIGAWLAGSLLVVGIATCAPMAIEAWRGEPEPEDDDSFGSESAWLTVYSGVSAGYAYVSTFLVAALLSEGDLAAYGAAIRYVAIVLGPAPALLAVLRVRTSQSDVVDSAERQAGFLVDWVKRTTLPIAGVLALAGLSAPLTVPLIDGGRYPDSIPIFQILLVSTVFVYATMPSISLLMTQRRFRLLALLYGGQLLLSCAASVAAGLAFGAIGVAVATTAVAVAETITVALIALRHSQRSAALARSSA